MSSYFGFILLHLLSKPAFSQVNTYTQVEIDRFAIEIQTLDQSASLISSIVSFTAIQEQPSNAISLTLPRAEEIIINKSKVRITDSKGNVIWKGTLEKKLSPSNALSLNLDKVRIDKKGTLPYTIEWETNVLLASPTGNFTWPTCLTGNFDAIRYLGLRVFSDDDFLKKIDTNLDQSTRLMDQSTGLSGVVWELSNYQKNKAWLNAKPIENPYIKLSF
ncbi:MAG: hypothetical protein AB1777_03810 [Bacteroidota bacterium]